MSILIKGMEMPKCCNNCDFNVICNHANGGVRRPKRCPLVEVSVPHGRLVDADALASYFENTLPQALKGENDFNKCLIKAATVGFMEDLHNAFTIIEAEGKDDG